MKLDATDRDEYSEQFESLLKSDPYKTTERIVYFFKVEKLISRVIGESNIIYIGRSDGSFSSRYYPSKAFNLEMAFFDKFYKHAIKLYGPISIEITQVEKTKYFEWKAIADYGNLGHPLLEINKLSILSLTTNPSLVRFTALTILEPQVITITNG